MQDNINRLMNLVLIVQEIAESDHFSADQLPTKQRLKTIVAVKINRSNTTPDELYGVGASWALSFTFESITQSINKA